MQYDVVWCGLVHLQCISIPCFITYLFVGIEQFPITSHTPRKDAYLSRMQVQYVSNGHNHGVHSENAFPESPTSECKCT